MVTPLQSRGTSSDTFSGGLAYNTANLSAGTKLIAYMCVASATCTAISDGTNSMTKLGAVGLNGSTANGELSVWAMDTPAGDVGTKPTLTPTFSTGGNHVVAFVIQEVPGLLAGNTTAMLDGSVVASSGSISSNGSIAAGSYSTAAAGEFLTIVGGDNEISTITYAVPTGSTTYTRDPQAQNATFIMDCVPAYGNSTGGAETGSFALTGVSGSNAWGVLFVAFKLASTSSPPVPIPRTSRYHKGYRYRQIQPNIPTPPPAVDTSVATPEPVVIAQPNAGQWFNSNEPIQSRSSLQDDVVVTSSPEPIVVAPPNGPGFFRGNQPIQSRSSFQDVPAATQPDVVAASPSSIWFQLNTSTILRNTLQDPPQLTTPEPVVVTSQPDVRYGPTKTTIISNPQVPPPVTGATPSPEVVTNQPALVWFEGNPAQIFRSSLQDAVVVTVVTPPPVIVTKQPDSAYYRTQAPQDFRNTTQDPPVLTTPDPVVVTSPTPQSWLKVQSPAVIKNPPAAIVALASPDPVVVQVTGFRVGQGGQVIVRRNAVAITPTWRDPQHLGGTAADANQLGGTVTGNLLGGTVTGNLLGGVVTGNLLGGSGTVQHTLGGAATVQEPLGGTATKVSPFGGTLDEWTMQEIDINLGEFNDETLAVAITNNGSPYDLTGKTLQALFKTAAGVLDSDPSTITLTSPSGGITVTNAVGGLANIAIPRADLQDADITFWRCDVVVGGLHNTAIYGKVGVTLL